MKFKSKPIKVEQDSCTSGSDLDVTDAMRSLSPLPPSSIQPMQYQQNNQEDSDLELTKLPSPSPISKFLSASCPCSPRASVNLIFLIRRLSFCPQLFLEHL